MAPKTRPRHPAETPEDLVTIEDSESEVGGSQRHATKRQKTGPGSNVQVIEISDDDEKMETNASARSRSSMLFFAKNFVKNAELKGRKRFTADLKDMQELCKQDLVLYDFKIQKIRPGDDEGSIELVINGTSGEHVLSLNLIASDTSDYPKFHSFFSYSPDDLPSQIQQVIEDIATAPSKTISETIANLCSNLAKALNSDAYFPSQPQESQDVEMDDDEGSGDDYEAFDEFDEFGHGPGARNQNALFAKLQHDFIDIVGTNFRPGVIRFGADDFCLSVSLPVITLAESIPPRALMAWDRRLLSRSQHLTLLISGLRGIYPLISSDGTLSDAAQRAGIQVKFKVGLCGRYKPTKEHAQEASRNFGLIVQDAEDELRLQAEKLAAQIPAVDEWDDQTFDEIPPVVVEEEEEDEGRFERFSLSSSLETLMDQAFFKLVQYRRKFKLGWAGAEALYAEVEKNQRKPEDVLKDKQRDIQTADQEEHKLSTTNILPHDPLRGLGPSEEINLPLTAFCYLVRRLTLCTRFCIVCHNKLTTNYEALKPYVCDDKLCSYQYYSLNRGPSLEYEILHNPQTVDLLVSIAYAAAAEGVIDEPLPVGMALRVPLPNESLILPPPTQYNMNGQTYEAVVEQPTAPRRKPLVGNDGLYEFDALDLPLMRACIAQLIDSLPAVEDMKKHLERKVKPGKSKPTLKDMDPSVLPAAWSVLRWCIGSCTGYLEVISPESGEGIRNLDPSWRQYRFSVGAPDAEEKFKTAVQKAQATNANARNYPSLYAFHGSPLRNWHSIIRHGLWFKVVTHGRAYGNGVYLAKEGTTSMSTYAGGSRVSAWRKSRICPSSCVALTEIVNLPGSFVSSHPHFVVADTDWLVCRYLLVKSANTDAYSADASNTASSSSSATQLAVTASGSSHKKASKQFVPQVPLVKLDPSQTITLMHKAIEIPEPGHQIETLLQARRNDFFFEDHDAEDQPVFEYVEPAGGDQDPIVVDDSDEEMFSAGGSSSNAEPGTSNSNSKGKGKGKSRPADDWVHNETWVNDNIANLMPPPVEASATATMALQRELRAMLKEQETCTSYKELGWFMPPDLIGDNLFQWIVEMHSFDPEIPIAKDMVARKVNSVVFEIRFPPTFPHSPPFFRIVSPRFLPFIHGGGGHVTGGGSICMDLLTADGWLPSYSISAVLMQIKLAISNLDPRPARLAPNWDQNYQVREALEGFKRAAATHNWQLPAGLEKLVM